MYRSLFYSELSTLMKRLSHNYDQYPQIQDKLKNVEVGDYDENYVTNLLKNTFGHQLIILSDISIGSSQADCLVITPYFCAVAFPFHTSIIKNESKQYPIFIGKEVLNYVHLLPRTRTFTDPHNVEAIIQKQSNPWQRFLLCEYYKVDPHFIKTGVECRACGTIPMIRINRTWKCTSCDVTDRTAHVQALREYYMLINKYITTQQAMHFLHLRNRYEAIRILKSVSIQRIGQAKSSKYELTI